MVSRVFLVEDSPALCAHLTEILVNEAGVEIVGIAETEDQAIDWLDHNADRWDVALVDLFLREGTGVGVVQHCRDRRSDQSIFVMTNHVLNDALLHHCKLLGANAVYHKANELDDLVANCIGLAARRFRQLLGK